MKTLFCKIIVLAIFLSTGCKFGHNEEETDAQAPRKGPVAALLNQDSKTSAADPWSLLLPTAILTDFKDGAPERILDICKTRTNELARDDKNTTCLDSEGHVSTAATSDSSCVGQEHDRMADAALAPIKRSLAVFTEVFCKAKSIGLISPSKKPGVVDLTDFKEAFQIQNNDRVSLLDAYTRAEKQTKGMYHTFLRGHLIDRGLRFSYDLVHLPHDKAGKEAGGRITIMEQNGEKMLIVSATYEIEEGMLALRSTRLESKPAPVEQVASLFNVTTGLLDLQTLRSATPALRLLTWPRRVDIERDFNRGILRVASQSLVDWQGDLTRVAISSVRYDEDKSGRAEGCGLIGLGGRWDLMTRISTLGMTCAKPGKIQRFVQKECFSKKGNETAWTNKEQKIAFAPGEECGFGTESFNLELINEEGNAQEVQSFDPVWPSLPGIAAPTWQ